MRPKLFQSFVIVTLFWFVITTGWWTLQHPDVNLESLSDLKRLLPFLPFEVPEASNILTSIVVQKNVILYWTVPLLLIAALSAAVGYAFTWSQARTASVDRDDRVKGTGNYRGLVLTVGVLPTPKTPPMDELDLSDSGDTLIDFNVPQKQLLTDILGILSAHPKAFAGEGVHHSLFDNAVLLVEKALNSPSEPVLTAIAVAAGELGKITAYKKNDAGVWVLFKNRDKESSKILAKLNSWYHMENPARSGIMMAVKFSGQPKILPEIEGNKEAYHLSLQLIKNLERARKVDVVAVVKAPKATPSVDLSKNVALSDLISQAEAHTVADTPEPKDEGELSAEALPVDDEYPADLEEDAPPENISDVVFAAFIKALPTLTFQNRNLPKGVAAVAWKVKGRIYLLEIKLRDTIMSTLPPHIREELTPKVPERGKALPFTLVLLKVLEERGWLVKSIENQTLPLKEAIWNVKAGKLEFKGVIIADVPPEYMERLPADNSMYGVTVTGPLFSNAVQSMPVDMSMLKDVLTPSKRSPRETV